MPKYKEDENGYLTFPDTPLSRPGVFPYLGREISPDLDPDKVYNVYRPESELNNPETIESFKLSPWFPKHQMAGENFTAAEDIGVQGTTGQDVRYIDGKGLVATVKTFGNKLKSAIRAGLRELSLGYRCIWDITSGTTPDGIHYDVVQRKIRGNHLASVEEGRMGSEYSLAMDRASISLDNVKSEGATMTLEQLLNAIAEVDLSDDEKKALKAKVDEMIGGKEANEEEEAERSESEAEDKEKSDAEDKDYSEDEDDEAMDMENDNAMDSMSKQVAALQKRLEKFEGKSMDAATIERMISDKNDLIKDLEPVVGKIDGSGLDANGVAKKAADILGIACDSQSALPSVRGYLHARKNTKTTVDDGTAQDGETATAVTKQLDELGV